MESLIERIPGRRVALESNLCDSTAAAPTSQHVQLALEDLGTPLHEATFVVVDLETTGGRPAAGNITEIGAVKLRGGEEIGHFSTLVRPTGPIPAHITQLTGISNALVANQAPIGEVFATFLQFAGLDRGHILVAHNARFDVSFLRATAKELGYRFPRAQIVDTLHLARLMLPRSEIRNHRLATLAAHFGATTTPNHRALGDARATGEVLHALLERLGPLGVTHVDDLATLSAKVPHRRRKKSALADNLPTGAGVYWFVGPKDEILYVGTATKLRRRVRSYFTAAENRRHIGRMLDLARAVKAEETAGTLEAQVRELRLIAAHRPPFNRRSRRQDSARFLVLTDEAYPRSLVTKHPPNDRAQIVGVFASMGQARAAQLALQRASGLRSCTRKLPLIPQPGALACPAAEMGRCAAPCVDASAEYQPALDAARKITDSHLEDLLASYQRRFAELTAAERFETAAQERDRLAALLQGRARFERLLPYFTAAQLVAARPMGDGAWELVVVRYGRLVGASILPRGKPLAPYLHTTLQLAESVPEPGRLGEHATLAETAVIASWCESPGVRFGELCQAHDPFAYPRLGAASARYAPWREGNIAARHVA